MKRSDRLYINWRNDVLQILRLAGFKGNPSDSVFKAMYDKGYSVKFAADSIISGK